MKKRSYILVLFLVISIGLLGFTIGKNTLNMERTTVEEDFDAHEEIVKEVVSEEIIETIEEPKIIAINLLAAGDIMFHSPQYKAAYIKESDSYDFIPTFQHIKRYVEDADIALANFETVTAGKEIGYKSYPRFNTPKESILAIKETGFDILSTANNHSLDHGKKGIISTIDNINEYGMKNIGTYKEANTPILIEDIKGINIGFLSYTYGLNGLDSLLNEEELSYMVNRIDEDKIKKDIIKTKDLGVDMTVVFVHWGNEYQRDPSPYQIELGEKMVEWGANIILGSHPHVIQNSQIVDKDGKDNFIIYSMGNFLSNQRKETLNNSYTEDGVMINLEIEKNFSTEETIIKNISYIPTWVHKYRENDKLHYEILPVKEILGGSLDIMVSDTVKSRLEKSLADTMDKMVEN
ncbi:CapA family protein [Tissierella sp.]|uniref:CapA family protein n=1 Tax=Tissierella sp. TaxID=41274 RepID=UPI0028547D40|nr:CapA family protein [Tissierella sp.]MDR7857701.1 CapA family protein [Tissierella sp.]